MVDVMEPKPKPEKSQCFVWHNRHRGFLIVVAKNVKEARAIVEAEHANWVRWTEREPNVVKMENGQSLYIKQRVLK